MKVNMHTSHPSAFISSTFIDLQEERGNVADALRGQGLNVNALDIKPASTNTSKNEIISGIRESDFVILLIGDRYGSILPRMTGSESRSITWWEYQKACSFGKPVIAYFKNMINNDSFSHDDINESTYKKKRKMFERFKQIISRKHNPAYFSDSFDLSEKIQNSLIPTYRAGVKALNLKNLELAKKVSEHELEIERLKATINNMSIETQTETSNLLRRGLLGGLGDAVTKYK